MYQQFRLIVLTIVISLMTAICGAAAAPPAVDRDTLYQVSTISALMAGVYNGSMSVADFSRQGNIGIGTFEGLDGEMIIIDGKVYQVEGSGKVTPAAPDMMIPFATITFFDTDRQLSLPGLGSVKDLYAALLPHMPKGNMFYAIRVDGEFSYVKTRSVPKQQQPYPPLTEVTKNQPVFEAVMVKGTLVGFWSPAFAQGINVPGFHLHFISQDRTFGGHLLDCRLISGTASLDETASILLVLPTDKAFQQADLAKDWQAAIHQAEK